MPPDGVGEAFASRPSVRSGLLPIHTRMRLVPAWLLTMSAEHDVVELDCVDAGAVQPGGSAFTPGSGSITWKCTGVAGWSPISVAVTWAVLLLVTPISGLA